MKIITERLAKLPQTIRDFSDVATIWIVGSAALWLVDEESPEPRDFDVIVPLAHWPSVSRLIPWKTPSNHFGGFKITDENGVEIDVWGTELLPQLMTPGWQGPLVAVEPYYQFIMGLTKGERDAETYP